MRDRTGPAEPPTVFPTVGDGPVPSWAAVADAHRWWVDSANLPDDDVTALLAAATQTCAAYSPPVDKPEERHVIAVVFHARDLWNARQDLQGPADGFYPTGPTRPMSAQVRQLLRPNRGPMVG